MSKRKELRKSAMELMFQMEAQNDFSQEALIKYEDTNNFSDTERKYIDSIFDNIELRLEKIDDLIDKNAKNWSVNRLGKVDLSILRVALIEMVYIENTPVPVAINEAVDLAKIYGSEHSAKFINGVLGNISRNMQEE